MEVKDIMDAMNPVLEGVKSEIKSIDGKLQATVAQLNEDAIKKGESIAELKAQVDQHIAAANRLKAEVSADASNTDRVKGLVHSMVAENMESIKSEKPFAATKQAVMTIGNNLTGSTQISYVQNPILRSFFNPHLYDVFRIIPTATGNVTFPRGNSPVGEGSFGVQTEGLAKAQVDYDVTMVNASIPFIAGFARVSRQMLQDLPFLEGYLTQSLTEDWNRAVNNRFLNAIASTATPLSSSGTNVAEKMIDSVAQHGALGLGNANLILTTHAYWASVLKTKPGDYSVPGGITIGANGETRIMGIPLVPHSQVTASKFYTLNTDAFAIAQAVGLSVRSTESNQDDFEKNLLTYRCEARIDLLQFQPLSAVYGG